MKTYYEYTSEFALSSRLNRPDGAYLFFSYICHDESLSDEKILEMIFAECNHGSGKENPQFVAAKIPSLSVGDTVTIGFGENPRSYKCDSFGWSSIA
jgi:hypothetical protein